MLFRSRGHDFSSMTEEARTAYIKEYTLHMIVELGEFLQELPNFKPWKLYHRKLCCKNKFACEELIDVFHFLMNICLAMQLDSRELLVAFEEKHRINNNRLLDALHYKPDTEMTNE